MNFPCYILLSVEGIHKFGDMTPHDFSLQLPSLKAKILKNNIETKQLKHVTELSRLCICDKCNYMLLRLFNNNI